MGHATGHLVKHEEVRVHGKAGQWVAEHGGCLKASNDILTVTIFMYIVFSYGCTYLNMSAWMYLY